MSKLTCCKCIGSRCSFYTVCVRDIDIVQKNNEKDSAVDELPNSAVTNKHYNWLNKNLPLKDPVFTTSGVVLSQRLAIKEFVKEFNNRCNQEITSGVVDDFNLNDLENIIKDMGVKLDE